MSYCLQISDAFGKPNLRKCFFNGFIRYLIHNGDPCVKARASSSQVNIWSTLTLKHESYVTRYPKKCGIHQCPHKLIAVQIKEKKSNTLICNWLYSYRFELIITCTLWTDDKIWSMLPSHLFELENVHSSSWHLWRSWPHLSSVYDMSIGMYSSKKIKQIQWGIRY